MSSTAKPPKVVLGKRPKSFKKTITGPMPDGTIGAIELDYVYRTRTEYGTLLDEHQAEKRAAAETELAAYMAEVEAAQAAKAEIPMPGNNAARAAKEVESDARLLLKIAQGWDLPDEFGLDAVKQFADEAPGLFLAAVRGYRDAIEEGRLGN